MLVLNPNKKTTNHGQFILWIFAEKIESNFEYMAYHHCPEGLSCPLGIRFTHQDDITDNPGDLVLMLKVGKYLLKYKKYRELII